MINNIAKTIDKPTQSSATLSNGDLIKVLNTVDMLNTARDFWVTKDLNVADKLTEKINECCKELADILELEYVPRVTQYWES